MPADADEQRLNNIIGQYVLGATISPQLSNQPYQYNY
jgi:hypothetical protein